MDSFSDYIVYADESGDHSLSTINAEFPLFVLTFCIFQKSEYMARIVPALQQLKFKHFGHDMIVMHEREIRKAAGAFAFLTDATRRGAFMDDINRIVETAPFLIVAVVIRKRDLAKKSTPSENLYHLALRLALESLDRFLRVQGQHGLNTHIVFEARGKKGRRRTGVGVSPHLRRCKPPKRTPELPDRDRGQEDQFDGPAACGPHRSANRSIRARTQPAESGLLDHPDEIVLRRDGQY